jgi:hypothetical protein
MEKGNYSANVSDFAVFISTAKMIFNKKGGI